MSSRYFYGTDQVRIWDGTNQLSINADGTLPVSHPDTTPTWVRDTASAVADNIETTVISQTVTGSALLLDALDVDGTVAAEWRVYVNNQHRATRRTEITKPSERFPFPTPYRLEVGDDVEVRVVHYDTGASRDFAASLLAHR